MATIEIEGKRYKVTENLGYQAGHYAKAVETETGERIAVRRGFAWTWWTAGDRLARPAAEKEAAFSYNHAHPIGTCGKCGREMVHNVPRLGKDGGFVHKDTGSFLCDDEEILANYREFESDPSELEGLKDD